MSVERLYNYSFITTSLSAIPVEESDYAKDRTVQASNFGKKNNISFLQIVRLTFSGYRNPFPGVNRT
jgi:hypothetical protein